MNKTKSTKASKEKPNTSSKSKKEYNEESLEHLEDTKGIRRRPGMYIGGIGPQGVKRLVYEGVGNAIDEVQAGRASNIHILIKEKESIFSISDDGVGIPVGKLDIIMTKLHSGGKFRDNYGGFSIGMNGVGLKAINALSEFTTVNVKREGYEYEQEFSKGKVVTELKKIKKTKEHGTTITFKPDIMVMKDITVNSDEYFDFIHIITCLNKGLRISIEVEKLDGSKIKKEMESKEGLLELLKEYDNKFLLKTPIELKNSTKYTVKDEDGNDREISMEVEILFQYSMNDTNCIKTFCNGLETIEGGSHETGFKNGTTRVLVPTIMNSNILTKKDGINEILGEDIREGIVAIVNLKHSDPIYESQTKDKLKISEAASFVEKTIKEQLPDYLNRNKNDAKTIYNRIILSVKGRLAAKRAKTTKKKEADNIFPSLSSVSKLVDCSNEDSANRRIFIVEGDSAGGNSSSSRNPFTDAIYKLRGKPLNTFDLPLSRMELNKEIKDMIIAFGAGVDNTFDISKLRYNQIVSMTDSDIDGNHISVLLATFIFKHMPDVIKEGHFYIAQPPLYKVVEGKEVMYFKDTYEYNEYITEKTISKFTIGRYYKKDDKVIYKKFNKEQILKFLEDTYYYNLMILNICSSNINTDSAIDKDLAEFLIIKNKLSNTKLKAVLLKRFPELIIEELEDKSLHIKGLVNNNYQFFTYNNFLKDSFKEVIDIIEENKYNNMYYIKNDDKNKTKIKVTISELLAIIEKHTKPSFRTRFKGLGEMMPEELWETVMNPDANALVQIKCDSLEELNKIFETQVGKDASKRKEFLKTFKIYPEDIDN